MEDSNSNDKKQEGQENTEKTTEEPGTDAKEDSSTEQVNFPSGSTAKRAFSDIDDDEFDDCSDGTKKKKRKDSDNSKDAKPAANLRTPARNEKTLKQVPNAKGSPIMNKSSNTNVAEKEQTDTSKTVETESENDAGDDGKNADSLFNGGLKVPPLKIVIPQQNCSIDTEGNVLRTGKINASRNAALPYVVSSSNESTTDKETTNQNNSNQHDSPLKVNPTTTGAAATIDEKNIKLLNEEKNLHRVLRSSHRSGGGGGTNLERSSNNSSPQMQSSSPSPASCNANESSDGKATLGNQVATSPVQPNQTFEQENIVNLPSPSTSSTSSSKDVNTSSSVDLHPRKRKIRSKNDNETNAKAAASGSAAGASGTGSSGGGTGANNTSNTNTTNSSNNSDTSSSAPVEAHPHDFPFTNGFQMYMNIRRQIENKWKNLYPVKPRPPQGYNDYLLTKRTYLLNGNREEPQIAVPVAISEQMRDLYIVQEKERYALMQRHTVEREKLCLNVEQEIIRVHSKAARNISCQPAPYSVCTLLKDDEVYNMILPEQDDKDKNNARYRFNGRLLLSWLQDVDDKWEKIKESMVLRHHNEAESLHAVQLMDWELALKRFNLCDYDDFQSSIEKDQVPIVHVSDDFDLLPA